MGIIPLFDWGAANVPFFMVFLYKRYSELFRKDSRVESIEEARNEYKKLLKEEWVKTYRFNSFFRKNGE